MRCISLGTYLLGGWHIQRPSEAGPNRPGECSVRYWYPHRLRGDGRDPDDLFELSPNVYALAAYAYDDLSLNAIAKVSSGQAKAPGKLPVALN